MALPPIDLNQDLEAEDELEDPADEGDDLDEEAPEAGSDVDPMFAADVAEAFPDLDDTQIAALQRAVLGLMGSLGGGGAPPAPAAPPMGF